VKGLPISPDLFDLLLEYANEIEHGHIDFSKPLRDTAVVLTFCQSFFAQFFENELRHEITSIDDAAKRTAVRLRRRLAREGKDKESLLIVTSFEKYCEIYKDVAALMYEGPLSNAVDFHETYVTQLLERALSWARSKGYAPLVEKVGATLRAWTEAMKKIPQ
jgi:hypothetical protein